MRPTIRYRKIMAALKAGAEYGDIARRFRMTLRDVWVYDSVRTHGHPREKAPKQTDRSEHASEPKPKFSREEIIAIDARHRAGESLATIARDYHVCGATIATALSAAGFDTQRAWPPMTLKRQIAEDFECGMGIVAMKQKYHMCAETIRGYVREVVGNDRYDDAIYRNRCAGQARRAAERTAQRDRRLAEET